MDPSFFKVPWIKRLLSTYDPQHTGTSEKQESLVAQVLNVKLVTDDIDGMAIGGQGEVHDNNLFVNAVFTKEAVQKFNEEEEQDGCSGAEFHEIKNSLITIKEYRIMTRLNSNQARSEMLICIEYFTLAYFDAVPRLSGPRLGYACQEPSIAANIQKLLRLTNEDCPEDPGETSHSSDATNNESEPHLTQLLDAIEKAAQTENRQNRTFVFEVAIPKTTSSESSSTTAESDYEDIHILNQALNEMERKLAIAKALHHHIAGTSEGQRSSQDSQVLDHNTPMFSVQELPQGYTDSSQGIMADFNEIDYEVPHEVLKKLESIEEWRPGYVPNSLTSGSASLELNMMAGGGLSSSVEDRHGVSEATCGNEDGSGSIAQIDGVHRSGPSEVVSEKLLTDNGAVEGKNGGAEGNIVKMGAIEAGGDDGTELSQPHSEAMSLGSEDWDMQSVESIGLSTEEMLLADSQDAEDVTLKENPPSVPVEQVSKDYSTNSANKNVSPANTKRKRQPTSDESASKIPRRRPPEPASKIPRRHPPEDPNKECIDSPHVFNTSQVLSPILHSSQVIQRNMDTDDVIIHSTPANGQGEVGGGVSEVPKDGPVEGDAIADKERSGPDLFESAPDESCSKSQHSKGIISQHISVNCDSGKKKKNVKVVQFDSSVTQESDQNQSHADEHSQNRLKLTGKSDNDDSSDNSDNSVEILNVSTGFEASEFYKSPPARTSDRGHTRTIAKLRSPQIPSSIPTPINSLPSHQPRQSRSESQSSAKSTNSSESTSHHQEVDSDTARLSTVQLEDEVLQWCTRYFINMTKDNSKQKQPKRRRDR